MDKPFLIEGYKFDLWIYVLVTWVNPLRIFLYKEGMAWFATEKYSMENITNSSKEFLIWHLTNYALNKENYLNSQKEQGEQGEEDCSSIKWKMTDVFETLWKSGKDVSTIWEEIKDIINKSILVALPQLQRSYWCL